MKLSVRHLLILLLFCVSVERLHAALTIEISSGINAALPIAIVPFDTSKLSDNLEINLTEIVSQDLNRSGVLKVLNRHSLPVQPHHSHEVDYSQWRLIDQDYLVVGRVLEKSPDTYTIEFQLLDVHKKKQLLGYSLPTKKPIRRALAHEISDLIYEKITGTPGVFNTRIAYIQVQHSPTTQYALQVADMDGFNAKTILISDKPLMSPSWSPDGQSLAYVSFETQRPEIFIQHLATAKRSKISSFAGMNSAPDWSPDGQSLALVLSKDGNPDIYVMHLATNHLRRLTNHRNIDTEPVWTNDGQGLIFTSARSSKPQLYEIALNDSNKPRRITFEGQYNAAAAISPNSEYIAMVHAERGSYKIALLAQKTGNLTVLTDSHLDESPSFSPNGKFVLYASTDGDSSALHIISIDGRSKHKLSDQNGDIRDPVWGPYKRIENQYEKQQ